MEVSPSSETQGTCQKSGTKFLKIWCTHVPTSWGHVKTSGTKFLNIFSTHVATPGARAPVVVCWALAEYSMANRKIAYTLGRGWAYTYIYIFQKIPRYGCHHFDRTSVKYFPEPSTERTPSEIIMTMGARTPNSRTFSLFWGVMQCLGSDHIMSLGIESSTFVNLSWA